MHDGQHNSRNSPMLKNTQWVPFTLRLPVRTTSDQAKPGMAVLLHHV